MNIAILSGILLIALGAFSSGSFAVPFGKIKDWKWETYWMVFSLGAYILFPLIACLVFAPDFGLIIHETSSETVLAVFFSGRCLWCWKSIIRTCIALSGLIARIRPFTWFDVGYWYINSTNY